MSDLLYFKSIFYVLANAIFDTLWQGIIVAFFLYISMVLIPKEKANIRYWTAYLSIFALFATFLGNIVDHSQDVYYSSFSPEIIRPEGIQGKAGIPYQDHSWYTLILQTSKLFIAKYSVFITLSWIVGILAYSFKLIYGLLYFDQIKKFHLVEIGTEWQIKFEDLVERSGVKKHVLLRISNYVKGPVTFGWLKPIVLVPCSFFTSLTAEQIEFVLLHELAHIRRNDYLLNIIRLVVQNFLFFHPVVWWAGRLVDKEREHAVDDLVLSIKKDSLTYIKTLVTLAEINFQNTSPALALLDNKNTFSTRIYRLIQQPNFLTMTNRTFIKGQLCVLFCIGLLSITGLSLASQNNRFFDEHIDSDGENTFHANSKSTEDTTKQENRKLSFCVGSGNVAVIAAEGGQRWDRIFVEAFPKETEMQNLLQLGEDDKGFEYSLDGKAINREVFMKLKADRIDSVVILKGNDIVKKHRVMMATGKMINDGSLTNHIPKDSIAFFEKRQVTIFLESSFLRSDSIKRP